MAHDVLYKHPNDEISYTVDYTDDLDGDTSISSGSAASAVDSDGTNAPTVIGSISRSGMVLTIPLQAGTDGEDYVITLTGRGTTTSLDATKIVEMRVRASLLGNV